MNIILNYINKLHPAEKIALSGMALFVITTLIYTYLYISFK